MKIKNILLLVLALVMVFALCACGGNNTDTDPSKDVHAEASTTDNNDTPDPDEGKVTYTVTVVDEGGNPVVGAFVQLCLESCIPSSTNAEGKATYTVEEADYKVSFVSMPTGYTSDKTEFHFAEGSYELTITLKAVA